MCGMSLTPTERKSDVMNETYELPPARAANVPPGRIRAVSRFLVAFSDSAGSPRGVRVQGRKADEAQREEGRGQVQLEDRLGRMPRPWLAPPQTPHDPLDSGHRSETEQEDNQDI